MDDPEMRGNGGGEGRGGIISGISN